MNEEKFSKIVKHIGKTVIKKNEMYGSSVFKYGQFGIIIRILDKFERMKHIVFAASKVYYDENEKFNIEMDLEYEEALIITIMDICGYCLLWMYQMVIDKESDMNGEII